ncbi:hypothetical protein PLICRDRAFT_154841 [Plicaturopsis crispa FD-325 SS-3]|nr:hypothetical protein PLICRDRAFT_154841 [Plicaturopsis crispa FD-325 SS-3]
MADLDWDLLSSYAGLLSLATISIYAGAFGSLPKTPQKVSGNTIQYDDDDEDEDITDRMSSEDAWLFPIIGSVVLFGLYTIVKYFGKEWINYLLGWYFSVAGVGSVWNSLIAVTRLVVGEQKWKSFDKVSLLALKGPREIFALSFRTPSLYLLPLGAIPSILYTFLPGVRKSVLLTDVLGLSFSHNALSLLKIDSFKTGCILLSGLFIYDIWWVFGTEVMVKVATNLDIPIKLMWPKSTVLSSARGFTMLGLGKCAVLVTNGRSDIVIPGTFVALALRYDHHRFISFSSKHAFVKPYFYAALSAYVGGLATTMSVMHFFGKAQPALLYLSPACILSFFITASVRGELKDAWNWSDGPSEPKSATSEESTAEKLAPPLAQPSRPVTPLGGSVDGGDEEDKVTGAGTEGTPKKKKSKKKAS